MIDDSATIEDTYVSRSAFKTRPYGVPPDWHTVKIRRWRGLSGQYRQLTRPQICEFDFEPGVHRLMLLNVWQDSGEVRIGAAVCNTTGKRLKDVMLFSSAAQRVSGWFQLIKPSAFVMFEFDASKHNELATISPNLIEADPMLRSILLKLRGVLLEESSSIDGYAEALGNLCSLEIQSWHASLERGDTTGGLTPYQLRTVTKYLDDHLDKAITVPEMADHLEMSQFHFIRMFKRAKGVSPYKYLIIRRVERAMEMIRGQQHLSIGNVAKMTGFRGVSQFSRAFRAATGVTPSEFKRGED